MAELQVFFNSPKIIRNSIKIIVTKLPFLRSRQFGCVQRITTIFVPAKTVGLQGVAYAATVIQCSQINIIKILTFPFGTLSNNVYLLILYTSWKFASLTYSLNTCSFSDLSACTNRAYG